MARKVSGVRFFPAEVGARIRAHRVPCGFCACGLRSARSGLIMFNLMRRSIVENANAGRDPIHMFE
jgi:hypothetical protein